MKTLFVFKVIASKRPRRFFKRSCLISIVEILLSATFLFQVLLHNIN